MLQTFALRKTFGALEPTKRVDFVLERGARHALIGPNGAGKTTLVNLLTGVLASTSGDVHLEGESLLRLSPRERVARGLVRTFQVNSLFLELTPLEAVALAILQRSGRCARLWGRISGERAAALEACAVLDQLGLADAASTPTRELPYGRQRLLEIALALACKPRVLLLDEPAAGIPEGEREGVMRVIADLPSELAILLIEHDMDLVFSFARRISVLVDGALVAEGSPPEIARHPRVREAYLGRLADSFEGGAR